MLAKKHCLKKKKDFQAVIRKGEKIEREFLVLAFLKNSLDITRIGFVVSRKISKKAVLRNEIKRRMREIIKIDLDNIKQGHDIIFFTKKTILGKDFSEIKQVVEQILKEAKLFNVNSKSN